LYELTGKDHVAVAAGIKADLPDWFVGRIVVPTERRLFRLEPQHYVDTPSLTFECTGVIFGNEDLSSMLLKKRYNSRHIAAIRLRVNNVIRGDDICAQWNLLFEKVAL
jgi:hypothetical protein